MGRILIGTSSWADPALSVSGFYPDELKTPEDRLRYYSSIFSLTEIDSSYHFLPTARMLSLWLESSPQGFIFDVKAFSLFTQHPTPSTSLPRDIREAVDTTTPAGHRNLYIHNLKAETVETLWQRFSKAIGLLSSAHKLGLIMFQFPPWFHFSQEHYDYILYCKQKLDPYPLGIEFRTPDWLNQEHREQTLRFLRENLLSLVCVDEPQGLKSSLPPLAEVTAPIGVVRFHGRNCENWELKNIPAEEKFNYLYSEAELEEWVPAINSMAQQAETVQVIFKNKHQDFPVQNARRMQTLLGK